MDDPPSYKKVPLPQDGQPKWLRWIGKVSPAISSVLTKIYLTARKYVQQGWKNGSKGLAKSFRSTLKTLAWLTSLPILGFANLMRWSAKRRYRNREFRADQAIQRGPVSKQPRGKKPFLAVISFRWLTRPLDAIFGKLWAKWWIRFPATILIFILTVGITFAGILSGVSYVRAKSFDMSRISNLESGCAVLDRNGKEIGRVFVKNREPVTYDQLPPHFIDALIATEDERYLEHEGNDFKGMTRAALANLRSMRVRQGASTITQQLARDVYELKSRSMLRKFTEIFIARRIEEEYNKEEILQHYVNRIYMGSGCWGVNAASIKYFGKEIMDVNVAEAALLCGIIKRPSAYSPFTNPKAARNTRNYTLQRMAELGFITRDELPTLKESPLGILPPETREDPPHYLLAQIRQEAQEILEERHLPLEGFQIYTTVDTTLQDFASVAMNEVLSGIESAPDYPHPTYAQYHAADKPLSESAPDYIQSAVVILHNATGKVVAAVGGRDFDHSQFNRVFQANRPAGSTFIPLVYAAAFESPDINPLTPVLDAPIDNRKVMIGGEQGVLGEWSVERFDNRYEGEITASYALLRSKNGATVRLGSMVGLSEVKSLAERAGIASPLRDYPSTFLGSSEVTPIEMARAYTLFPNRGWAPRKPALVASITKADGSPVYKQAVELRFAVLNEVSAVQVSNLLHAGLFADPVNAVRESVGLAGKNLAVKTGTAYDFTDAWTIGFNADYTCAVWVGFDSPQPIFEGAFGHKLALPIWAKIMQQLENDNPLPVTQLGHDCTICMHSGQLATQECQDSHGQLSATLPFTKDVSRELSLCQEHSKTLIARPLPVGGKADTVASKSPLLIGDDPYQSVEGGQPDEQ